ncbi:MAG: DUF1249 domain-containing protein [Oceanospirillaceae bacterium]|nr:DUF1249 domain-containing protein [Oceanospirillaceae bacterium]MCP5336060.1 DUF1249 domain-containing protein [Oceanospirillaceae bacterium]
MVKNRRRYVPDLKEISGLCEANYIRLLRLLPEMDAGTGRRFTLSGGHHSHTRVSLEIVEQFKYTLTIKVSQVNELSAWLKAPEMLVRLYHDARMAEVISYDKQHRFEGVYHYPNEQMRLPDEKLQINQFLSEWLQHCLAHGEADISLNFAPNVTKCDSHTGSD